MPRFVFPLCELPTEIVEQICSHLCAHCQDPMTARPAQSFGYQWALFQNRMALVNLTRTCHALHRIVTPFLYHTLWAASQPKHMAHFLDGVLRNPHMRSRVRVVDLWRTASRAFRDDHALELLEQTAAGLAQPASEVQGLWIQPVLEHRSGVRDTPIVFEALLLLLFSLCRNIEQAHLTFYAADKVRLHPLPRQLHDGQPLMANLRRLTITFSMGVYNAWYLSQIEPLTAAAVNLEYLECDQVYGVDPPRARTDLPERPWCGRLRELRVSYGPTILQPGLSEAEFPRLLELLRHTRLERFVIGGHWFNWEHGDSGGGAKPAEMALFTARVAEMGRCLAGGTLPHLRQVAIAGWCISAEQAGPLAELLRPHGVEFTTVVNIR